MLRRRVLLSLIGLVALGLVPGPEAEAAGCTRVIGGSQTTNWYVNGRYETMVTDGEWERQTSGGQDITTWGVGGSGWSVPVGSPCAGGTVPTRVVLHVLPNGHDPSSTGISADIVAALAGIAANVPSATRVTLLPPVGGIGCDDVDLSRWQPAAVTAIGQNLGDTVDMGPTLVVPDCSYFRDVVGHLTGTGASWAATQLAGALPDGGTPPPPPPPTDSTAPTASITSPAAGATVSRSVQVSVTATDNVGVTRVELKVDGGIVATDTASPYQLKWNTKTVTAGTHTLTAVAYDAAGNSGTSPAVTVTVSNGTQPPPPPPPPPSGEQFTVDASTVAVGVPVTFTDAHPGSHRRVFTFGDGASTTGKTASAIHAFAAAGTYTATLQTLDVASGARVTLEVVITVTG